MGHPAILRTGCVGGSLAAGLSVRRTPENSQAFQRRLASANLIASRKDV
jgi:hypothetical protein